MKTTMPTNKKPKPTENAALAAHITNAITATPPHDGLLNKAQLAALLQITKRGVECLVARKRIPVIRMGHRSVRFAWPRVQAALEKLTTREI